MSIHLPIKAVSIVYNFRVAQITKRSIVETHAPKSNNITLLPFDYFQKTRDFTIKENYGGALVAFTRNFKNGYYIRADTAFGHVSQKNKNITTTCITEVDDILITGGKNILKTKNSHITLSGMLGIPTHETTSLQRPTLGFTQFAIGAQLDGLYGWSNKTDFLWGTRYVYFIPRTARDNSDNRYKFTVGSLADLLIGIQTNTNVSLTHCFEGGYTGRWGFGAHATPKIDNIERFNYIRNSIYLVYKYTLQRKFTHRFLFDISYGFESKQNSYNYDIFLIWASWTIAF